MSHLDEGTMLAVRDGASENSFASAHLAECHVCNRALIEARARSSDVAEALSSLDEPLDVLAAKAAVRRLLDSAREAGLSRRSSSTRHLGRAAAILLLTAGAAWALPWSSIQDWWGGPAPVSEPATEPVGIVRTVPDASEGGISVSVPEGSISVSIRGAAAGSVIDVLWVSELTTAISAPPGSDFAYAEGRAVVDVTPGTVRVELPRTARSATLEVDGREYLRRTYDLVEVSGPAVSRTPEGVRFVIPEG